MKIKAKTMGIIIFALIFGGIGLTAVTGLWGTKSSKIPVIYQTGEAAGSYDPSDIRGSYSFAEVSSLFDIEEEILFEAFSIPEDTDASAIKLKELEALSEQSGYEIGTGSVRVFVALYKNLPIELGESYLPESAAVLIRDKNVSLSKEQSDYLEHYTIN